MEHQIINNYLKTYLIGPIEKTAAGDNGSGWRTSLRLELDKRRDKNNNPIYVFDPILEEKEKTGYSASEFHKNLTQWIIDLDKEKIIESTNLIWKGKHIIEKHGTRKARLITILGDCDYVLNSDFLILKMEEKDSGCGTFGEAYEAYKQAISIYVIQTMPIVKYPRTLIGWVYASGGDFFKSQEELLTFLDEKYKLSTLETK